ncbi:MAG: pilus assembly FimT family protein [Opitutales bacterium]|jgi:prepilin-type N-terminal cleavage/methylation domain-containing protein
MKNPLQSRSGLTLVEMVVSIALLGAFMTLLSFHLVGLSNLWLNRTNDDFFEQHVEGVVLFLTQTLEASESAAFGENEQRTPVEWARPPGWSQMDDPLLHFQQNEAPALLVREGQPLPAILAYLQVHEDEGLSIIWYSALDAEEVEDERDLRRTPVSTFVRQLEYAYYELEDDEWEITDEPMENDQGEFRLPDFIRLTFFHPQEGTRVRSLLIPHGSIEIPLF